MNVSSRHGFQKIHSSRDSRSEKRHHSVSTLLQPIPSMVQRGNADQNCLSGPRSPFSPSKSAPPVLAFNGVFDFDFDGVDEDGNFIKPFNEKAFQRHLATPDAEERRKMYEIPAAKPINNEKVLLRNWSGSQAAASAASSSLMSGQNDEDSIGTIPRQGKKDCCTVRMITSHPHGVLPNGRRVKMVKLRRGLRLPSDVEPHVDLRYLPEEEIPETHHEEGITFMKPVPLSTARRCSQLQVLPELGSNSESHSMVRRPASRRLSSQVTDTTLYGQGWSRGDEEQQWTGYKPKEHPSKTGATALPETPEDDFQTSMECLQLHDGNESAMPGRNVSNTEVCKAQRPHNLDSPPYKHHVLIRSQSDDYKTDVCKAQRPQVLDSPFNKYPVLIRSQSDSHTNVCKPKRPQLLAKHPVLIRSQSDSNTSIDKPQQNPVLIRSQPDYNTNACKAQRPQLLDGPCNEPRAVVRSRSDVNDLQKRLRQHGTVALPNPRTSVCVMEHSRPHVAASNGPLSVELRGGNPEDSMRPSRRQAVCELVENPATVEQRRRARVLKKKFGL